LRTETLLDDFARHLAGTKAVEAHVAPQIKHALAHAPVEIGRGELHGESALKATDIFERNLHALGLLTRTREGCAHGV